MRVALVSLLLLLPLRGQEEEAKILQSALAAEKETFQLIELKSDGTRTDLEINLASNPVIFGDEEYDGFRFICPKDFSGQDFVWYFNAPATRTGWYILPAELEPSPAFKDWLDADKAYLPFDKSGEEDRFRAFQALDGSYFKAGAEYILWFRGPKNGGTQILRGAASFKKSKGTWDHASLEEALSLAPAPVEQQVAALKSRGGKILLDERFFERDYASGRIDSCFTSIRSTKKMRGGMFITLQTFVPPCTTTPSLDEIVKQHGPADFIRSTAEQKRVRQHAGAGKDGKKEEPELIRHYYDHFSLEVESGVDNPKVIQVGTHGSDFSALSPPSKGNTFSIIDIENITVFHRDGKEVGRAYYFLEGGKKPLFITTPPEGEYRFENLSLVSTGGGKWEWLSHFSNGKVARKVLLTDDRFNGNAEGFHENGKTAFKVNYKDGEMDGEALQFDEAGKEVSKEMFKDGKPVEK